MVDGMTVAIAVGIGAMVIALFERGYRTYLEEKKANPDLEFSMVYLLNILMSAGGIGTIIVAVIPAILSQLGNTNTATVTLASVLIQATIGYLATYRVLDGLNNGTTNNVKLKTLKVNAAKEIKGNVTIDTSSPT
jgi:hypothetical protein